MTFKLRDFSELGTVNVEVNPDGRFWSAQGMEVDYVAQGDSLEDAIKKFRTGLEATIGWNLKEFGHLKHLSKSRIWKDSLILAIMQFFNWGICTISWRAVAQANMTAAIITDTTLATLTFFLFRKIANSSNENAFIPWIGYTVGGVAGTVLGIYTSILWLGK